MDPVKQIQVGGRERANKEETDAASTMIGVVPGNLMRRD